MTSPDLPSPGPDPRAESPRELCDRAIAAVQRGWKRPVAEPPPVRLRTPADTQPMPDQRMEVGPDDPSSGIRHPASGI